MQEHSYILSIDQGTSGTKVLIFDEEGGQVEKTQVDLASIFRKGGWVEQDPEAIYSSVLQAVEKAIEAFQNKNLDLQNLKCCGISNQRETFLVWDEKGKPLYNAIVWQCKRSSSICDELKIAGKEAFIKEKTGLIIDPYFSGTKMIWLKRNEPEVSKLIEDGEAYFGTVDTWLLYRLTKGDQYLTDYTNACRTLFFNLRSLTWDEDILQEFDLKGLNLPEVKSSSSYFGTSNFEGILKKEITINAMIGDSHAAAFGEQCFSPGTAKATLGTGCSVLMNTGSKPAKSIHGMVSTICWSTEERIDFALEGVIVSCGATIEWLKNELGIITDSKETEEMALKVGHNNGVYLVPAFSGLGAPYWEMNRKAAIVGLTFDCNKKHIVRAALEAIPYQIKDVITAMERDVQLELKELNLNGGIRNNAFVTRFLADLLKKPVNFMKVVDVSALGAAYLAGIKAGIFRDLNHLESLQDREVIKPKQVENIEESYSGWLQAVQNNK